MDLHSGITLGTPILAALTTGLMTLLAIYLKRRLDRQDAAQDENLRASVAAAVSSALAADRTEPTGNGFARAVRSDLKAIRQEMGGLRADQRATNGRLDDHARVTAAGMEELRRRLNQHLDHQENR